MVVGAQEVVAGASVVAALVDVEDQTACWLEDDEDDDHDEDESAGAADEADGVDEEDTTGAAVASDGMEAASACAAV